MRDSRLGVSDQQILTVRHGRRIDGVSDRSPKRSADEKEGQRGPEGVCDQAKNDILEGLLLREAAIRRDDDRNERDIHKSKVEEGHVVE